MGCRTLLLALFSFTQFTFPRPVKVLLPRILSFYCILHKPAEGCTQSWCLCHLQWYQIMLAPHGHNLLPIPIWTMSHWLQLQVKIYFLFLTHFMGTFSFALLMENTISNNAIKQLFLLLMLWEKMQAQFLLLYIISGRDTELKDFQQQAVHFGRSCKPPWCRGLIGNK